MLSYKEILEKTDLIAWTGGSNPRDWDDISEDERRVVLALYEEQIMTFKEYWNQFPTLETCGTFWSRARYDAHATFRRKKKV